MLDVVLATLGGTSSLINFTRGNVSGGLLGLVVCMLAIELYIIKKNNNN